MRGHDKEPLFKSAVCLSSTYHLSSSKFLWNLYVRNPFKIPSKDHFIEWSSKTISFLARFCHLKVRRASNHGMSHVEVLAKKHMRVWSSRHCHFVLVLSLLVFRPHATKTWLIGKHIAATQNVIMNAPCNWLSIAVFPLVSKRLLESASAEEESTKRLKSPSTLCRLCSLSINVVRRCVYASQSFRQ